MERHATTPTVTEAEARAALDAVAEQRRHAADRLVTPHWYHPVLGLLLGQLFAAQAAHTPFVTIPAAAIALAGMTWITRIYRRRTGVWASGMRRGRAGRITVALTAAYLALFAAGAALDFGLGYRWGFLLAGAAIVPVTILLGRRYDEALRAELREAA